MGYRLGETMHAQLSVFHWGELTKAVWPTTCAPQALRALRTDSAAAAWSMLLPKATNMATCFPLRLVPLNV